MKIRKDVQPDRTIYQRPGTSGHRVVGILLCLISWIVLDLTDAVAQSPSVEIHARHRPPDMFVDDSGNITGPLVEIVNKAAEMAGVEPVWLVRPMANSLGALEQGSDIVLPRLYRAPEREGYVLYHGPFNDITKTVQFIYDTRRPVDLNELADLFRLHVGVRLRGYYGMSFSNDKRISRQTFPGEEQLIVELGRGTVDAIALTNLQGFTRMAEDMGYTTWEIAEFVFEQDEAIWIGTARGSNASVLLESAFRELVDTGAGHAIYEQESANDY